MRIVLWLGLSVLVISQVCAQNFVGNRKFNQGSKNNKCIALSGNLETFNGSELFAQKSRGKEKSFGLGLSTNGGVGFSSRLNYAYINPVVDVLFKNKSDLVSIGLLVPVIPVYKYKYWVSFNYLWGISKKEEKSWVYGVNVDFSSFRYRYYFLTNPRAVVSYYKKYSSEVVFQGAFFRKLSKSSFYCLSIGAGVNIAFINEAPPPPTINSGTIIKPIVKIRLCINTLLF